MTLFDLFCLPFAGSGASFYRGPAAASSPRARVVPVQLAGREERFVEPPYETLHEATVDLTARVEAELESRGVDRPFCLFGHSFGAVLAFEIARTLCRRGEHVPAQLFLSGSAHPEAPLARRSTHLSDAEFVRQVESLAGYEHPALAEPELREIVLPALRTDVEMHESYQPAPASALAVPITTLRGVHDTLVTRDDCAGWARWTTRRAAHLELDGGHMYLTGDLPIVLEAIVEEFERAIVVETQG